MMKKTTKSYVLLGMGFALALAAGAAQAIETQDKLSIGLQAGTTGIGLSANYDLNDSWSISGVHSQYNHKYNTTENDIDYRFKLGLHNTGLLAHFKPFQGNFRITGGLYHNNNEINGHARYSGADTLTIGNITYAGTDIDQLNADVSFRKTAPYLGVGYTKDISSIRLNADLGVLFQGSPRVNLRATPSDTMDAAAREQLRQEVERERRSLENDLRDFRYYPVASVGVAYRF